MAEVANYTFSPSCPGFDSCAIEINREALLSQLTEAAHRTLEVQKKGSANPVGSQVLEASATKNSKGGNNHLTTNFF